MGIETYMSIAVIGLVMALGIYLLVDVDTVAGSLTFAASLVLFFLWGIHRNKANPSQNNEEDNEYKPLLGKNRYGYNDTEN